MWKRTHDERQHDRHTFDRYERAMEDGQPPSRRPVLKPMARKKAFSLDPSALRRERLRLANKR